MTNRANVHSSVASSSSSTTAATASSPRTSIDHRLRQSQLTNLQTHPHHPSSSSASPSTATITTTTAAGTTSTITFRLPATGHHHSHHHQQHQQQHHQQQHHHPRPHPQEPEKMNALISSLNDDDRILKELEMQERSLLQRRKIVPASFTSSSATALSSTTSATTAAATTSASTTTSVTSSVTYTTVTSSRLAATAPGDRMTSTTATGRTGRSGSLTDSFNPSNLSKSGSSLTNVSTSNYTKQPSSVTQFTATSYTNVTNAAFNASSCSSSSIYTGPSTTQHQQRQQQQKQQLTTATATITTTATATTKASTSTASTYTTTSSAPTTVVTSKLATSSTANLTGSTASSLASVTTGSSMVTGSTYVSASMKKLNDTVTSSSTTADLITASLDDDNRILRELEQQEANLLANRRRRLPGLDSSTEQPQQQHSVTAGISHQSSDTATRASLRRQTTLDDDLDMTASPKQHHGHGFAYGSRSHRQLLPSLEKQSKSFDLTESDLINGNGHYGGEDAAFDDDENEEERRKREEGLREVKRLLRKNLGREKLLAASAVATTGSLDDLMAKLDRDNKILAELDKNIYDKALTSSGHMTGHPGLTGSLDFLSQRLLHQSSGGHMAHAGSGGGLHHQSSHLLPASSVAAQSAPPLIFLPLNNLLPQSTSNAHHHLAGHPNIGGVGGGALFHHQSTGRGGSRGEPLLISEAKDIIDSIEVPNRGRARVFIAKYSYDPFRQSPNENPESELSLAAGDFVLVFGDIDSDGFYFGELLDGRRGLVPSNFVQQLTGEDLFEFQASVLYLPKEQQPPPTGPIDTTNQSLKQRLAAADHSDLQLQHQQKTVTGRSASAGPSGGVGVTDLTDLDFPAEFYDAILDDAIGHTSFQHLLAPEDFHRMNDYVELADAENEQILDEDDLYPDPERAQAVAARDPVPPPKRLVVERQLHKSVLLSWLHPDAPRGFIDCFHVYVDGVLKISVPASERTKALIEGVDSSMAHRISVRAVTPNGRMSRDAACTVVIGKNIPFAPCCVKATNITSESALISWLPCNSNFYHVVAVNSVEVKTVNPSTYKHLITGE